MREKEEGKEIEEKKGEEKEEEEMVAIGIVCNEIIFVINLSALFFYQPFRF